MTEQQIMASIIRGAMFREEATRVAETLKDHELVQYIELLLYSAYDWAPEIGWTAK